MQAYISDGDRCGCAAKPWTGASAGRASIPYPQPHHRRQRAQNLMTTAATC